MKEATLVQSLLKIANKKTAIITCKKN